MAFAIHTLRALCGAFLLSQLLLACSHLNQQGNTTTARPLDALPQSWRSEGKISLRAFNPQSGTTESRVFGYHWQQQPQSLLLELKGTLNLGRLSIESSDSGALIRRGDKILSQAATLDQLLWEETGISLPTHLLQYWILGLPSPAMPHDRATTSAFQQAGWTIEYPRYTSEGGYTLPVRLNASNEDISLRVAISRWQLGELAP